MVNAKVIEKARPHTAAPVARVASRTSPAAHVGGTVIPVEVPKLTDLPCYMDALGWKVSAALMRKWFAADAREMTLDEKLGKVPPRQYPRDLLDTTTVTLDWILGFRRAEIAYQSILNHRGSILSGSAVYNEKLKEQLVRRIRNAGLFASDARTFGDLARTPIWQHENWQVQLVKVDVESNDRLQLKFEGLDDLFGALGGFALYLAAYGTVTPNVKVFPSGGPNSRMVKRYLIEMTHAVIYAKDTYDFNDQQYLGHWNREGVEVKMMVAVQDTLGTVDPDIYTPFGDAPDIKFPVGNESFRRYRGKHGKGGDLLIFSDMKVERFASPFRFCVTPDQVAGLT